MGWESPSGNAGQVSLSAPEHAPATYLLLVEGATHTPANGLVPSSHLVPDVSE
jgi:hypothetical protein